MKFDMHWLRLETTEEFEQAKMALDEIADCADAVLALPRVNAQWHVRPSEKDRWGYAYASTIIERPLDLDGTKLVVVEAHGKDWVIYFETIER